MEELVMPDESDRRRGRVVRVPAEDQPNVLEHRVGALESELQEARDHNRRMEKELWEATNKISELLSERYGADAASTGLGEDRDTAGRGETTEATSKLDAELGQAAFSAAHTGRLNLENVDRPLVTTDVAISAESFHRCATVLDAVQMDYPMVHLAPSWAPLDLTNSDHREPMGQGLGAAAGMTLSALEIIERARYAHWAAYLAGLRCEAMPVPRARRSFATLLTKFLKTRLEAASRRDTEGRPGGAGAPDLPGLEVTVHTERSGLLVYYSPLYYPATRRVFGVTQTSVAEGRARTFRRFAPSRPLRG